VADQDGLAGRPAITAGNRAADLVSEMIKSVIA
jgi:hypothetical protein